MRIRRIIKFSIFSVIVVLSICLLFAIALRDTSVATRVSIEELWRDRDNGRRLSGRLVTVSGQISWISPDEELIRLFDKDWNKAVHVFLAGTDSGIRKRIDQISALHTSNLTVKGSVEYDKEYSIQISDGVILSPCPVLWAFYEMLPSIVTVLILMSGTLILAFLDRFRTILKKTRAPVKP